MCLGVLKGKVLKVMLREFQRDPEILGEFPRILEWISDIIEQVMGFCRGIGILEELPWMRFQASLKNSGVFVRVR